MFRLLGLLLLAFLYGCGGGGSLSSPVDVPLVEEPLSEPEAPSALTTGAAVAEMQAILGSASDVNTSVPHFRGARVRLRFFTPKQTTYTLQDIIGPIESVLTYGVDDIAWADITIERGPAYLTTAYWGDYSLGLSQPDTGHAHYLWTIGRPLDYNPVGPLQWSGRAVSTHMETGDVLHGRVSIVIPDAATAALTVDLTLGPDGQRIRWEDVPMNEGVYRAGGLIGKFYGPNHEETAGHFNYEQQAGMFLAKQR